MTLKQETTTQTQEREKANTLSSKKSRLNQLAAADVSNPSLDRYPNITPRPQIRSILYEIYVIGGDESFGPQTTGIAQRYLGDSLPDYRYVATMDMMSNMSIPRNGLTKKGFYEAKARILKHQFLDCPPGKRRKRIAEKIKLAEKEAASL